MAWSYHSEPTPLATSQRAPPYDTPHSFPLTAPPSHHHTSSHYEPVLSSPDDSPSTSPGNSPHSSPASSRSSTPPLTHTYPLPKARQRSHSHSELFRTHHGHPRATPNKPHAHTPRKTPAHTAHATRVQPPSYPYRPRPPSPTLSHSSVDWITLEGETEASDAGSQIEVPPARRDEVGSNIEAPHVRHTEAGHAEVPHARRTEFLHSAGGSAHTMPSFPGAQVSMMTHEITQDDATEEQVEFSGVGRGASESASPPIIHSHTHTHKHFIYASEKLKPQDLAFPSDAQGWDFDMITSLSDTDTKTRTHIKGKKRESSSSRRLSKSARTPLSQSHSSHPPSSHPPPSHSHTHFPGPTSHSAPVSVRTTPPSSQPIPHTSTPASMHHSAPPMSYTASAIRTTTHTTVHQSEAGVGDLDVHADTGEDFERGLDMWKGSTMEIAARLRQAEQERRELQRQLLNASYSSRSNSNSK
eukprot:Phypoly_transcript_07596.p1 GENE.Phypoly_transcript_07596~~Phypoly_transcript_07596.p1  ORF type:complete len:514 (-),score=115.34 Phypoly_transcript_07596:77-1486(-)